MFSYFLLSPATDLVKIGRAKNPETRAKALQIGCPDELVLLLTLPHVAPFEEHQLHKRFDKYRTHGEWFEYRGDLKKFISQKSKSPVATSADDVALCTKRGDKGEIVPYEYPKNDNKLVHNSGGSGYTDDCQRGEIIPFKSQAYSLSPVWLHRDWHVWSPSSWSRTV